MIVKEMSGYNMSREIIEFNGKVYPSVKIFAEDYNIPARVVYDRRRNGWSWERIVSTPITINKDVIEFNGEVYESVAAFARTYNLPVRTVYARRNRGWTWERIASESVSSGICYAYNGIEYKSLVDLAKTLDISYAALKSRLNRGMTLDEAIKSPARESKLYYRGNYYSKRELAELLDISYKALEYHLYSGKSVEVSVDEARKCKVKKSGLIYDNEWYKSIPELASETGIGAGILRRRLAIGLSLDDTVNLPLGVSTDKLQSFMSEGKTLQEALDILLNDWECCSHIIRRCSDVDSFRFVCNNKYVLITCKICSKTVLLPLLEAYKFVHSDDCIKNEWLD